MVDPAIQVQTRLKWREARVGQCAACNNVLGIDSCCAVQVKAGNMDWQTVIKLCHNCGEQVMHSMWEEASEMEGEE